MHVETDMEVTGRVVRFGRGMSAAPPIVGLVSLGLAAVLIRFLRLPSFLVKYGDIESPRVDVPARRSN